MEKAKQDKKSVILRAMGEAESARLIGTAVEQNPNFLRLRRLEASRDIADILSTSNNRVLLNSDNLLLNSIAKDESNFEGKPLGNYDVLDALIKHATKLTEETPSQEEE